MARYRASATQQATGGGRNRFVRWRKAGVWDRLMSAVTEAHEGKVQMIDTSIVRVHQQGATAKRGIKIIVSVAREVASHPRGCRCPRQADQADAHRRPEERHRISKDIIVGLPEGAMLLADKGYDANALRAAVRQKKAWANIPPKANRKDPICFSPFLYKARNLAERFFKKAKQFRRVATRYDKLADNYLAALKLVSVRIWLRDNESTS